jgi:hypothetical protein
VTLSLLRRTTATLRDTPALFAPTLAVALLIAPGVAVRPADAGWANLLTLAAALVALPVGPFVHAGAVGLADAALAGDDADFRAFLDAGRRGYFPTLVGSLALGVGAIALSAVVGVLGLFAVFATYPGGAAPPSEAAASGAETLVAVTLGVAAVVVLLALSVVLLVHLYAHAAVVDDRGILGCVPQSVRVVLTGGRTTLGYAAVALPVAALAGATAVLAPAAAGALPTAAPVAAVLVGGALVAVVTACVGLLVALSTAFYRSVADAVG